MKIIASYVVATVYSYSLTVLQYTYVAFTYVNTYVPSLQLFTIIGNFERFNILKCCNTFIFQVNQGTVNCLQWVPYVHEYLVDTSSYAVNYIHWNKLIIMHIIGTVFTIVNRYSKIAVATLYIATYHNVTCTI